MTWFKQARKRYKITREKPQFWHFPELGVGYIQIPKVATRSIRAGLMGSQGSAAGFQDFAAFEDAFSAHLEHEAIRQAADTTFVFAFVRHPLARLYSAYADKILNARKQGRRNIFACHGMHFDMTFDQFVDRVCEIDDRHIDRHLRAQAWFLTDQHGLIPQFIGHLESFNSDWDRLRERFPTLGEVPHLNLAAGETDVLAEYSPASLDKATERFQKDFDLFGYQPTRTTAEN
jgi:hypothetical protein